MAQAPSIAVEAPSFLPKTSKPNPIALRQHTVLVLALVHRLALRDLGPSLEHILD
jgi:hypothetical protein